MLLSALQEWCCAGILTAVLATLPALFMWRCRGSRLPPGAHVLITGGSKGLGLALALECVRRGCNVTIVARNQQDLQAAVEQLKHAATAVAARAASKQRGSAPKAAIVQAISADTTSLDKVRTVDCSTVGVL